MIVETLHSVHGSDLDIIHNNDTVIRFQLKDNVGFFYLGSKEIQELRDILDRAEKRLGRESSTRYRHSIEADAKNKEQLPLFNN